MVHPVKQWPSDRFPDHWLCLACRGEGMPLGQDRQQPSLSIICLVSHFASMSLLRSTSAAFTSPKKKVEDPAVEIVDPSQLDSFGTQTPGLDAGRNKELCSSPRAHPVAQAKTEKVDKGQSLLKLMQDAVYAPPSPSAQTSPAQAPPPPEVPVPAERDTNSPVVQLGSPCFRSSPWRNTVKSESPPVGHYRPKFGVVERSPAKCSIRGRLGGWSPSPAVSPQRTPSPVPASVVRSPTFAREATVAASAAEDVSPRAPSGEAASSSPSKPGKKGKVTGSAPFLSGTKSTVERPAEPLRSPDKFYWPYNEISTSRRPGKGAFVAIHKQWGRNFVWNSTAGPDVFYNVQSKDAKEHVALEFKRQVPLLLPLPRPPAPPQHRALPRGRLWVYCFWKFRCRRPTSNRPQLMLQR